MIYFADLSGKIVKTPDEHTVGRVLDLYFLGQGQPLVTKLVIQDKKNFIVVPFSSVKSLNGVITLQSGYETAEKLDSELSLRKNLLDQQIIDLKGNKVVRVNDVVIQDKPYLSITGVDVSVMGILRWLGIEKIINKNTAIFGKSFSSANILPWDDIQPLELARGKVVLKHEEQKLTRLSPEDLADHLERLSIRNITRILSLLDDKQEALVIQNLNLSYQQALFKLLKPEKAAQILSLVDPDEAVDIILTLNPKKREAITAFLSHQKSAEIDYLISLTSTDIGKSITTEFIAVEPEFTTAKVKQIIREKSVDYSWMSYIYVVNKRKELVGVFNLHELLLQSNETPVFRYMMPNVSVVHLTTPKEIAIKKMLKFKISAAPVINERKEIIGIVTLDDLLDQNTKRLI